MEDEFKQIYLDRMIENLHVLRAKLGVTQSELAEMAGISKQTILSLEKRQRGMTWNMFLALLYVFTANESTLPIVDSFKIRDEELNKKITG